MPPPFGSLEDYWWWVEKVIAHSGGWPEGDFIRVSPTEDEFEGWIGLTFPAQRILFGPGTSLEFRMAISAGYNVYLYTFHFRGATGEFLWRKDKGQQHPEVGETHIHRRTEKGDPDPYHEVDLVEVLEEIHDYHETGKRP